MITRTQQKLAQESAALMITRSGIRIREDEKAGIEVVDFGLGRLEEEGVQVLTLLQTGRISVKVLVLMPNQTEPEHWHPPVGDDPGKEETIRVVSGTVFFYVQGEDTLKHGFLVKGKEEYYTLRHEIILKPGDQTTFQPGEKHWFQARDEGAVMFSFSSVARDAMDRFTDPDIVRTVRIEDE
jgi:D-lyxose ketol-isomerase